MSLITHFSKSREPKNLISRIETVLHRFGSPPPKYEHLLKRYVDVAIKAGCVPTFPITAVTLKRHLKVIRELSQQGVEFAVHGYVHIDYKMVHPSEQAKHLKKAIDIFKTYDIPFVGFRAPFFSINGHTAEILKNLGFMYHSDRIIHWPVIDLNTSSEYERVNYDRPLEFYTPLDASRYLVLPRLNDGIVDIPVSIPDDEAMVDRLGITDEREISKIWSSILERTYSSGELFTVQLHPERILFCEEALRRLLQQTKAFKPLVWVATLKEIAEWWQEKDNFTFKISSQDDGRYRIKAKCSDRATILFKNCNVTVPAEKWFDGYQNVSARDFILESPKRPVIGIKWDSSPAAIKFLQSEGYIVELNTEPNNRGIYLGKLAPFDEADEKKLVQEIEQSGAPILKYWRWPYQTRSALSVTGDIDPITTKAFVRKFSKIN